MKDQKLRVFPPPLQDKHQSHYVYVAVRSQLQKHSVTICKQKNELSLIRNQVNQVVQLFKTCYTVTIRLMH